jgi:hypothetical protein
MILIYYYNTNLYNLYFISPSKTLMVNRNNRSEVIEQGDILFLYRPKVIIEGLNGIKNVQRFYMITSSEDNNRCKLSEIVEDKSISENWALNILTLLIQQELMPAMYTTETRVSEEYDRCRM